MTVKSSQSLHNFHIPVLGTGFSIDSPLKVAKYGITSVISIVDDKLIEQIRKYHARENGEPYTLIPEEEEDSRSKRITAYLNLLDKLIERQVEELKKSPFVTGSEITKYFEMLPQGEVKDQYLEMLKNGEGPARVLLEEALRIRIVPGSIDVNIMTKLDRQATVNGREVPAFYSDATSALRGYANSTLDSSVVFSAGINPRLFNSMGEYTDFFADKTGHIKKKIILKVSDYRSAQIQGILLAKKGLWVSEFRIESGLNCGGHAFATKGNLLGPILEEFHSRREELTSRLFTAYAEAAPAHLKPVESLPLRITVQGGIGTSLENDFVREHYHVDSIGWGTPFMLVPEVINLDDEHLKKLAAAGPGEVYLSQASPLGVLFWNLRDSASEILRRLRITRGKPGAVCRKGFLALNCELSEKPLCAASSTFQKLKIEALKKMNLPRKTFNRLKENALAKACICYDLSVSITKKLGIDPRGRTAVTPGPNIVNFSKIIGLKEMVAHIYGKINLIATRNRPHVFIREIELYVEYLKAEMENKSLGIAEQGKKYFMEFHQNLMSGIQYYRELSKVFISGHQAEFQKSLDKLQNDIKKLLPKIERFAD